MEIIIGVIVGLAFAVVVVAVFFALKKQQSHTPELFTKLHTEIEEMLLREREHFADQVKSEKDLVKELMQAIKQDLVRGTENLQRAEKERVGQYSSLKTAFDEYKVITSDLKKSTDSLKNILSNNQLRGSWGEEVAENLLQLVGFVKGEQYTVHTNQEFSSTHPDFTINMPDGTKVNVDVKFPYQALRKYVETDSESEKESYRKQFISDVRAKIKEITTRDYINTEENTVDFVVLFVPNEMIFSFIYDELNDVWNEAMQKKVIMAGPFSFTAILRTIYMAYRTFSTAQNIQDVLKNIRIFEEEYEKYGTELEKLGDRIAAVSKQYNTVSETRTRKLSRIVERLRNEDVIAEVKDVKLIAKDE